ncbi:hypothetical protein MN608_01982 [Microdochium nivale]|nr:hypothetical protein MN608_01982 [Microdochium nivale]
MASVDNGDRRRCRTSVTTEAQPWTTARCNRMLRPLQSRVAAIRRDLATPGDFSVALARPGPSPARNVADSHERWFVPRKKRYRTYSQRRPHDRNDDQTECTGLAPPITLRTFRQAEVESTSRNQMYPPTPLLRRATDQIFSSPVSLQQTSADAGRDENQEDASGPRRRGRKKQATTNKQLSHLRGLCTPSRFADFEAIYRSLEALLVATVRTLAQRKGSSSLLDVCLRRVPEYIAGVEAWEMADAEESGRVLTAESLNTSARVYDDLELLGTNTGRSHLRAVVLADGIRTLALAVEDGLWIHDFTQSMASLCTRHSAFDEAESILLALSNRLQFEALSAQNPATQRPDLLPHAVLLQFARETGRKSFVLEQYEQMITHDSFSMDWLMSEDFNHLWETSIRILSKDAAAPYAVAFVTTLVISIGRHLPRGTALRPAKRQALDVSTVQHRTIISALAAMASVSFLGEYGLSKIMTTRTRTTRIGDRLRYILRACNASFRQQRKYISHIGYSLTCLALLCSSLAISYDDVESGLTQSLRRLWNERTASHAGWTPRWREHFDILVSLLSSVSITCSRGTGDPPQHFLDIFMGRLQKLDLDDEVVDGLKTASAFHLAQQTNNVRDLIYAENLHRPAIGGGNDSNNGAAVTPVKTASSMLFTGYTWDDTIGEWVTATPATTMLAIRTPQQIQKQHDSEDSDDDLSREPIDTPETRTSVESTPYTIHSACEMRLASTPRLEKRVCVQGKTRQSLSVGLSTVASASKRDVTWESEDESEEVDDVDDSWLEDELALDQNCHNDEDREADGHHAAQRLPRAKRRRTHSGLFTAARSNSRRRGMTSRTISRGFVDEPSSDDELGL